MTHAQHISDRYVDLLGCTIQALRLSTDAIWVVHSHGFISTSYGQLRDFMRFLNSRLGNRAIRLYLKRAWLDFRHFVPD